MNNLSHPKDSLSIIICNGRDSFPINTINSLLNEIDYLNDEILIIGKNEIPNEIVMHGDKIKYLKINDIRANIKRNYGASIAKGEYILFLDDDVQIRSGWRGVISKNIISGGFIFYSELIINNIKITNVPNENGLIIKTELFNNILYDINIGPGTIYGSSEVYDLIHRFKLKYRLKPKRIPVQIDHPEILNGHEVNKVKNYSMGNGYVLAKNSLLLILLITLVKCIIRLLFPGKNSRKYYAIRFLSLILGYISFDK